MPDTINQPEMNTPIFPPPTHPGPLAPHRCLVSAFLNAEIPVLAATARALEDLRANEDDVDANKLTTVIQADPLMTLKLLSRTSPSCVALALARKPNPSPPPW